MRMLHALAFVLLAHSCSNNPVGPKSKPLQRHEWYRQNPLPQGNTLWSISFTDANTGTVVGLAGKILRMRAVD